MFQKTTATLIFSEKSFGGGIDALLKEARFSIKTFGGKIDALQRSLIKAKSFGGKNSCAFEGSLI